MVFQVLMGLPHFWIIFILSFVATLLTTIIYKYATDQKRLKEIKTKLKDLREKQKKHKGDNKKIMSLQKEMMELNMEMMKQSFRSMLYTFIPLILLFSWMSANIAYEPINPGEEFSVTARISNSFPHDLRDINLSVIPQGEVSRNEAHVPSKESRREVQWLVSIPDEGRYSLVIESSTFKEDKEVLITESKDYLNPIKDIRGSQLLRIEVGNRVVRPLGDFSLFGWRPNWLWTYILLSVFLSIGLRKLFKVS
jgi:uncharacterized membrane protein (DUF106 family)